MVTTRSERFQRVCNCRARNNGSVRVSVRCRRHRNSRKICDEFSKNYFLVIHNSWAAALAREMNAEEQRKVSFSTRCRLINWSPLVRFKLFHNFSSHFFLGCLATLVSKCTQLSELQDANSRKLWVNGCWPTPGLVNQCYDFAFGLITAAKLTRSKKLVDSLQDARATTSVWP